VTTTTLPMLETYPQPIDLDRARLAWAIDALIACSQACTACADACLGEEAVAELTACIRADLDCADVCAAAARVLSRHPGREANIGRALLEACVTACTTCGDECARHAEAHEHCRICAAACRACAAAAKDLLTAMR
jgi:hypothetical protein